MRIHQVAATFISVALVLAGCDDGEGTPHGGETTAESISDLAPVDGAAETDAEKEVAVQRGFTRSAEEEGFELASEICAAALVKDYTLDARAVVSGLVREADTDLTERELRGLVNDLCHRDIQALGSGPPPEPEPEPEDEPPPALDVQFVMGSGVTGGARDAVAEGLAHAAVFVEDLTGHRTEDFTVFLYTDREELLDRWMRHRGRPAHLRARERDLWTKYGGRAGDGFFFWLNSEFLTDDDPDLSPPRQLFLTHEYVHVLQYRHEPSGQLLDDHTVPRIGPEWLNEGVAEYLAMRHFASLLPPHYPEDRYQREFAKQAQIARTVEGELRTLETRAGLEEAGRNIRYTYALSSIAAQQLAQHAGEAALLDYYVAVGETSNWRTAFESTFSLSIDEFYEMFDDPRPDL